MVNWLPSRSLTGNVPEKILRDPDGPTMSSQEAGSRAKINGGEAATAAEVSNDGCHPINMLWPNTPSSRASEEEQMDQPQ